MDLPTLRRALDADGYAVLPAYLPEIRRRALAERVDALFAAEGARGGVEVGHAEPDVRAAADLVNKGVEFDAVWNDPLILAAAERVLGAGFRLSSLNTREPLRGAGGQGLHADWGGEAPPTPAVFNSLWVLDGFDGANGATRVVPGSHRRGACPAAELPDEEIAVRCPPGSVVVFNAHLWHGGGVNRSGGRRRVVNAYYCAAGQPQQTDQSARLRPETRARLLTASLRLLGALPVEMPCASA